jgi:uncharacterized protein YegP (UPF0339 family)
MENFIASVVRPVYVDTYQDGNFEWRYRFRAANGNILCSSGDGYATRQGCKNALTKFINKIKTGAIIQSNRPKSMK